VNAFFCKSYKQKRGRAGTAGRLAEGRRIIVHLSPDRQP